MASAGRASKRGYDVVTLSVSREHDEALADALWQRGTLGLETLEVGGESRLVAYFERGWAAANHWEVGTSPKICDSVIVAVEDLEERDWLESYRRTARPILLGKRFRVLPGDVDVSVFEDGSLEGDGRITLRLPARRAFGTGSHESTRLAVEMLEAQTLANCRLLDVGTGSGILSFAALALGAPQVFAVEVDPVATLVALENQALNGTGFPLYAGRLSAMRETRIFDLALVNVIPERIFDDLPLIAGRLKPGGRAIITGFSSDGSEPYLRRLESLGLSLIESRELDGWGGFLMMLAAKGA